MQRVLEGTPSRTTRGTMANRGLDQRKRVRRIKLSRSLATTNVTGLDMDTCSGLLRRVVKRLELARINVAAKG